MKAQAALTLTREGETLTAGQGEVLFTEYGVSGPAVFDLSRAVAAGGDGLTMQLDFLPGWPRQEVMAWLERQRQVLSRQEAGALLTGGVHPRLGRMLCKAAGISGGQPVSELTDRQLEALCRQVREFTLPVTGTCGFDQAQVTAGGLRTGEFDPRTMESRLVPGVLRLRRGAGYRRRLRGLQPAMGLGLRPSGGTAVAYLIRKGDAHMRREALWDRLYLSGVDSRAAELARENGLGLEIAAFCYAPNLEDPAVLSAVRSDMAGLDRFWFHAPFAELAPCAIDPLVRQVTEKRYRQAADMARELGIRRLVIHGGFVPQVYFPEWYVEQSVLFWREFLRQLPQDMTIALENVMEPQPRLLAEIARQVDDPRLGLCLDVGHANTFVSRVPPLEWVAPMAPWLRHVHLHNNAGHDDLHDPLGQGTLAMEQVLDTILELCPAATFTLENQDCGPSLAWLREHRYGANT